MLGDNLKIASIFLILSIVLQTFLLAYLILIAIPWDEGNMLYVLDNLILKYGICFICFLSAVFTLVSTIWVKKESIMTYDVSDGY